MRSTIKLLNNLLAKHNTRMQRSISKILNNFRIIEESLARSVSIPHNQIKINKMLTIPLLPLCPLLAATFHQLHHVVCQGGGQLTNSSKPQPRRIPQIRIPNTPTIPPITRGQKPLIPLIFIRQPRLEGQTTLLFTCRNVNSDSANITSNGLSFPSTGVQSVVLR